MKIGNIELESNLVFAPIAGFSEVGFRAQCAKYGAGLTYTEMVSAKGLHYINAGTQALLETSQNEKCVAVQLFGSDPEIIREAAADTRLSKFDIIDINMGCPVKRVFSNGEGSALMMNPNLIAELVAAAKEGGKRPVSVKLRAGITFGEPLALECALAAERGGADAVTIHPRYREQFYSGEADHNITREVKEALKIPVIANGDIVDAESLARVKVLTGADGFMIARGALGRPYIFSELRNSPYQFSAYTAILEHIALLSQRLLSNEGKIDKENAIANKMKLQLCHYAKCTKNAKAVRVAVGNAKTLDEIFAIVDRFF